MDSPTLAFPTPSPHLHDEGFSNQPGWLACARAGGLSLVAGVGLAAVGPTTLSADWWPTALAAAGSLGAGGLMAWTSGFARWQPAALRRQLTQSLRQEERRLQAAQHQVIAAQAEREVHRGRYEQHRQELDLRKQQYRHSRDVLAQRIDDELATALAEVARRRNELLARAEELSQRIAVGSDAGASTALALRSDLEHLVAEAAEGLLREHQAAHLKGELLGHDLEQLRLPGLGARVRQKLLDHGLRTAADLTPDRLSQVDGLGPKRMEQLLAWKASLVADARRTQPVLLPEADMQALAAKFAQEHQQLHAVEQRAESIWQRRRQGLTVQQADALARLDTTEARLKAEAAGRLRERQGRLWHVFRLGASDLMAEGLKLRRAYEAIRERTRGLQDEVAEARRSCDGLARRLAHLPASGWAAYAHWTLIGGTPAPRPLDPMTHPAEAPAEPRRAHAA